MRISQPSIPSWMCAALLMGFYARGLSRWKFLNPSLCPGLSASCKEPKLLVQLVIMINEAIGRPRGEVADQPFYESYSGCCVYHTSSRAWIGSWTKYEGKVDKVILWPYVRSSLWGLDISTPIHCTLTPVTPRGVATVSPRVATVSTPSSYITVPQSIREFECSKTWYIIRSHVYR